MFRADSAAPLAVKLAAGGLAFLSLAGLMAAQNAPADKVGASQQVSYSDGQLKIEALHVTLAELLAKVTALTGVKIELPAGVSAEPMPIVKLGPGPARQILATLLSDSNLDYLIQASDQDPGKLRAVLIMPRDKRGGAAAIAADQARPSRSPYARGAASARSEEEPATDTHVAEATPVAPEPAAAPPEQPEPPPSPDGARSARIPLTQPGQLARTGTLSPPATLNPESISQQLQQMYQQRMLINQQERQTVPQAANSGSK